MALKTSAWWIELLRACYCPSTSGSIRPCQSWSPTFSHLIIQQLLWLMNSTKPKDSWWVAMKHFSPTSWNHWSDLTLITPVIPLTDDCAQKTSGDSTMHVKLFPAGANDLILNAVLTEFYLQICKHVRALRKIRRKLEICHCCLLMVKWWSTISCIYLNRRSELFITI